MCRSRGIAPSNEIDVDGFNSLQLLEGSDFRVGPRITHFEPLGSSPRGFRCGDFVVRESGHICTESKRLNRARGTINRGRTRRRRSGRLPLNLRVARLFVANDVIGDANTATVRTDTVSHLTKNRDHVHS